MKSSLMVLDWEEMMTCTGEDCQRIEPEKEKAT
jgi:hypothetical protein